MRTMRKASVCAVIIALIVCLGFQVPGPAQAATWKIYGYEFTYTTTLEWYMINSKYTTYAWMAAKQVLNKNYLTSLIPVSFYNDPNDKASGYAQGVSLIKINTARVTTWEDYGRVLAHETSHSLFHAWAQPLTWNPNLKYQELFLTEALAYYTGNCVYAFGPKYSDSTIREQLSIAKGKNGGKNMTWWESGYYYEEWFTSGTTVTKAQHTQAWWQLHAIGSYLTRGFATDYTRVTGLMGNLRYYSGFNQWSKLSSSDAPLANAAFEYSFLMSYGRRANSGSQLSYWTDINYLSGNFYLKWQF